MTTKVKPTVEKWEFDVADYVHQGNYDDDLPIYGIEEANKAVKDLVSHSVQEAKAERDEKAYLLGGIEALTRYLDFVKTRPDKIKFWIEWYKHVLSLDKSAGIDHLSTLNTKEGK